MAPFGVALAKRARMRYLSAMSPETAVRTRPKPAYCAAVFAAEVFAAEVFAPEVFAPAVLALTLTNCSQVTDPARTGHSGSTEIPAGDPELRGAPFVFRPTTSSFGVNAVLGVGDPAQLALQARPSGTEQWGPALLATKRAPDVAEWEVMELVAGARYDYRISRVDSIDAGDASAIDLGETLFDGSGVTQRPAGQAYTFALLSDSHIGYDVGYDNQGDPIVLSTVGDSIATLQPDFIVNLGDLVDFHQFGFNAAPPDGAITRGAYLNYRDAFGRGFAFAPHFNVIGNWEGENGNYSADTIQWSRDARMLYMPGPEPSTYPLGGSRWQDYYAFTWGDATYFVLNVMTYTPTEHLLSNSGGAADDWTLGAEQLQWFTQAVAQADTRWKFVMIHHAVGGKAGDEANSRYGRGGGQAATVGEQAVIHQLMRDHGVQVFFYGHDHVFVDMTVDGIHYTQPGSAGAPWKFTTSETGYEQYWSDSGWASVDVAPDSVHVAFFSTSGSTLYEYTLD